MLEIAALSILYFQIITNNTKHSLTTHAPHKSIYTLCSHSLTTHLLSHFDTTAGITPNDTCTCPGATHTEAQTRPRSECVGCQNGSLPSLRSVHIIIRSFLHSGTASYPHGITPGESRSDAEHRIGIFFFLRILSLF
jgi:hypothetical protein